MSRIRSPSASFLTSSADAGDSRQGRPFLAGASAVWYKVVVWDLGVVLDAGVRQYICLDLKLATSPGAEMAQPLAYILTMCSICACDAREREEHTGKGHPSEPLDAVKHSQPITDTPVPL